MKARTTMMDQYQSIKNEHLDKIVFFRLGDFYEMFHDDAREASRILGLTLTKRQDVPMCGIPHHSSQAYIRKLLQNGRKVVICEQVGTVEKGKAIVDRQVSEILSPGALVDDHLLPGVESNYLAVIFYDKKSLYMSLADPSTGHFLVLDNPEGQNLDSVMAEFVRWSPRELLFPETLPKDHPRLYHEIKKLDMTISPLPVWYFSFNTQKERLLKHFSVSNLKGFGLNDQSSVIIPAGVLLEQLESQFRQEMRHIKTIEIMGNEQDLQLDGVAIRNLELVRNLQDSGPANTLFESLNETLCPMGARLLRKWILQPLNRLPIIWRRQEWIETLRTYPLLKTLRKKIALVPDLERIISRLALSKAGPKDLAALRDGLSAVLDLFLELKEAQRDVQYTETELDGNWGSRLLQLLRKALMETPQYNINDGGVIRPGYSVELDRLQGLTQNQEEILKEYVTREQEKSAISGLKLKYNKILGYFFELTRTQAQQVPGHFIRKQSLVGNERFTTEELQMLESDFFSAQEKSLELEKELFKELSVRLAGDMTFFIHLAQWVAHLDVCQSLAWIASNRDYCRPEVHDGAGLLLRQARHPVVELCLNQGEFIHNDLVLESDREFLLITGPNMAGKSTYLRQAAIVTLMAHMGSFVPAQSASIGLVDKIFCRIGASDNLAGGESTFLVEMNETAAILRKATNRSLVVMDEVGRGTATDEGLAIAWAVCEDLLERRIRTLFATHFHELTQLDHPRLVNASLAVQEEGNGVVFLRKLITGAAKSSYAIHVASLAGIPFSVLHRAKQILQMVEQTEKAEIQMVANQAGSAVSVTSGEKNELFSPKELFLCEVESVKPDQMSPLEALQWIYRLKENFKKS